MSQYGNLGDKISVPREVSMHILVCNSGSSSLKFSLFEAAGERLLAEGGIDWSATPTRSVVRCTGQPEVCEELTLRHHADAIGRILDVLQGNLVCSHIFNTCVVYSLYECHCSRCIQISTVAPALAE